MTNLNGGNPFNYTGQTINVGTITSDVWVHIYDDLSDGPTVNESVGIVNVTGTSDGGRLFFQICTQTDTDAFDDEPRVPVPAGLRNFGGLAISHPTDPNDTSLRDHAAVVIAVAGDITGNVTAGQLYRIDALPDPTRAPELSGHISGNLTATYPDTWVLQDRKAITYIRAANTVSGSITATGIPADQREGGIERIVLNPVTDTIALSGNVSAPTGRIVEIVTTGQIGSTGQRISIQAGVGIDRIRAVSEDAGSADAPSDRDFHGRVALPRTKCQRPEVPQGPSLL